MWARYAYLHIESATDTWKYETFWISWCTARCQLNCKYIACIAWETTMHVFVRHSPVSDIPPFYPTTNFWKIEFWLIHSLHTEAVLAAMGISYVYIVTEIPPGRDLGATTCPAGWEFLKPGTARTRTTSVPTYSTILSRDVIRRR